MLALVVGLGVMLYLDRRLDEEIRKHVQALISESYPDLDVDVRSARFFEGEGISIRGVRIHEPDLEGPEGVLFDIDEVFLYSSSGLQDLLRDALVIDGFVMTRPRVRATCDASGEWNLNRLMPLPNSRKHTPVGGRVQNGSIEIIDASKSPASTLTLRDIHITFEPLPSERESLQTAVTSVAQPSMPSEAAASSQQGPPVDSGGGMHFTGSLRGDRTQELNIVGDILPGGRWRLAGDFSEIEVSPELHASLPRSLCPESGPWEMLRASASGEFAVEYLPRTQRPLAYHVDVQVSRGRVDDVRLPYPLTDVKAEIRVNNGQVQVVSASARSRNTEFELTGDGLLTPQLSNARLHLTVRRLMFDRTLHAALPPQFQESWSKFHPAGEADIEAEVVFDGQSWRPTWAHAETSDMSFAYHKFAYRLHRAAGWIDLRELDNRRLRVAINLRGFADNVPVDIQGDVIDPGPDFIGWIQIEGSQLRLDEEMIAALPSRSEDVIRSLNPAGTFNVWARFEREKPHLPLARQMQMDILDGALRYKKFPYPIVNVSGHISLENDSWRFENLHGTNGGSHVRAWGTMGPTEAGNQLALTVSADGTALDEDLRSALPPAAQLAWSDLKPRGDVDLHCQINYLSLSRQLDLRVDIRPIESTCSLEPQQFPYRWENISGNIAYNNGRIEFTRLHASHGETELRATGIFESRGGEFLLRFDELDVDHVVADRELKSALPYALRQAVIELRPEHPFNVSGSLAFHRPSQPGGPMTAGWDLDFFLHGNTIHAGRSLENLYGRVGLQGRYDGQHLLADGELDLESARIIDLQYNQIRGPLHIENDRVILGDPAVFSGAASSRPLDPRTHRHLTAEFYGGKFLGDLFVARDDQSRFFLRSQVDNADLRLFARDGVISGGDYRGRLFATLDLRGAGNQAHSLFGDGTVQLRNADFYELPLLVALLKVASLQTPDASAFNSSDVEYRISGDRVYFNRLDFNGDAVSLIGKGDMDFDRNVNLSFGSMVGRSDRRIPILGDVLGEATKQFLKINVSGPAEDPQVTTETFPGVVKTLQQIQTELERSTRPPPRAPPVGGDARRRRY
ncbi:MAG: hypothetical protein MPJ50_13425 [Pirellulales bacterium]|nr:hypothetical protein [Pirellulales bacterium]